ncbi:YidH family protein [Nocardioides sp. NPDC087217]|uniref:YidH family protein n=1 Tax=Nocardioides sp. NPDC087217 TaxID=3364335 RepID=UPI0037FCFFDA
MSRRRWPSFVYEHGNEPDYRFSFANERTFLAWVRTALALLAAGVAVDAVDLSIRPHEQRLLALTLVLLSMTSAVAAWIRWSRAERAMRHRRPLPAFSYGALLTSALLLASLIVAAAVL